jgi:hypothetical protein
MYVERNIDARSRNHCYNGEIINVTHYERVSAAYRARKMQRRIILSSSMACLALLNFSALSPKRKHFSEKN